MCVLGRETLGNLPQVFSSLESSGHGAGNAKRSARVEITMFDHDHYMRLALELGQATAAKGNRPLGSLLVGADGEVVSKGENRVYTDMDPTAHGETIVIRDACRRLQTLDLSGTTLYTSLEPCPMCCWAIFEAKVS